MIQGTLAKVCDLSICRVPLTHNIHILKFQGLGRGHLCKDGKGDYSAYHTQFMK